MNSTGIIILGTNGNCIDIAETVAASGFLDDAPELQGKSVAGLPVLGKIADAAKFKDAKFVNGIGSPRSYRKKPDIIANLGLSADRWATVIHPTAVVSPSAKIGAGTVLLANVSVGANVTIGRHVMVLQNTVISHDSVVGDFTAIATGVCISGACQIGTNCYLGSGSTLRDGVRVGDRALIGIGSNVVADVPAEAVVMGNPAKPRV